MARTEDYLDPESILSNTTWMRALARALVADPAAADDVVSETWLELIRKRPVQVTDGWLAAVVRNLARRRYRAERARRRREEEVAKSERVDSTAAELAERVEMQRMVASFVLELDEPYRSTVLLRFFDELRVNKYRRDRTRRD